MRKQIFDFLEGNNEKKVSTNIYDTFMMFTILISLVPLMIKEETTLLIMVDRITLVIFIVDYILRLITADFKYNKGFKSFVMYPFGAMAIIDLISILPSFLAFNPAFKVFKVFRLIRTLKVFRVFKIIRYSKNIRRIVNVIRKQKVSLGIVGIMAIGFIFTTALIMFNIEPDTFDDFFAALYWATISLTTVGYGDVYATSQAGRIMTMLSALMGIAIVALPSGIITAGYMEELEAEKEEKK